MPRLLTLSLTETTREKDGYHVITRDLDNHRWVMINVPMEEFRSGQDIKWDLFAVTEADIMEKSPRNRPEEYVLTRASAPRLAGRYSTTDQRVEILNSLAVDSIANDIQETPGYVGIVVADTIQDISMSPKKRGRNWHDYDPGRPFFWESRISFRNVGEWWGLPCKDMRWKNYWFNARKKREHEFNDLTKKWVQYMSSHQTYFLIECYAATPNFPPKEFPVISGVHCF